MKSIGFNRSVSHVTLKTGIANFIQSGFHIIKKQAEAALLRFCWFCISQMNRVVWLLVKHGISLPPADHSSDCFPLTPTDEEQSPKSDPVRKAEIYQTKAL